MKSNFYRYLEMVKNDSHDTGEHHVEGSKQSGSKATSNPVEFVKQIVADGKIEKYITKNEYVSSPARLALMDFKKVGFNGTGKDALIKQDVSKFYNEMPEDMKEGETRKIDEKLYWERRMKSEIPCIVDKDKSSKNATHIAAILGPNNVVWAAYPCAGADGVAPPLNKASISFWKKHVFAGK